MPKPKAPLEELVPIQDIYCSGVSHIENMGNGLLRIWFFVNQAAHGEGAAESIIVAKLVIPVASVATVIEEAQAAMRREAANLPNFITERH